MHRLVTLLALSCAFGLVGLAHVAAEDATPTANIGPFIVPPGEPAFGRSQSEWGATWFRWFLDNPSATEDCAAGQAGPVWFLPAIPIGAGTFTFDCVVPADRAILIPAPVAANVSIDACEATVDAPVEMGDGVETRGGVEGFSVLVDGKLVPRLDRYRITPTLVPPGDTVQENKETVGTTPPRGAGWFACGYFVLLHQVPPGEHTVRLIQEAEGRQVEELTYALTVVPPGQS